MAMCASCGSADQFGRYCTNCGGVVAAPAGPPPATVQEAAFTDTVLRAGPPVSLHKGPPVGFPSAPGSMPMGQPGPFDQTGQFGAPIPFGPQGPYQGPPTQNYPPFAPSTSGGGGGRWKGWLIAAAAFVVVVAVATTAILVLRGSDSATDGTVDPTTATQTAAPPESSEAIADAPVEDKQPGEKAVVEPSADAATTTTPAGTTPAPAPSTTVPTAPVAPAIVNPLTGPQQGIACGSGYIVQVASELDQAALDRRVNEIQAANQLPAGTKWTDTNSSCGIFTSQINVFVVYSGPYASPYDACPARLSSPPDAFIKGATPETSKDYISCLCPQPIPNLPPITAVGQQGVWVGELQRVLGARLDYAIGNINADPSIGDPGRWGIYTAETAAAVGRFQAASGLPATNQVDGPTWAALQSQSC